ncbi:MAG: hypothetical protein JXP73_21940 [Deltaproteobacteria bacterium]|nr:hypothetical protein [Deltaproteobacteria bacterium]
MIGALASLAATLIAFGEVEAPRTDGPALELAWDAPAGCPDLASVRAEIHRRIGDVETPTASEPIAARGEILVDASGNYILSLQTRVGDITGERVLAGQDCHQLADAAALVLALLVNPKASAAPAPPGPPPLPPPPPSSQDPPGPARQRSGLGAGIAAVLADGVLPGLAQGLAARLFYQRGLIVAAVHVAGFLPKEKPAPLWPGATASFYRLESAIEICATTPPGRRVGGALCLGGALVRLHGESAGVSTPGESNAHWIEALFEPSGHVYFTPATRLRLAADLRGLGARPDFAILGLGTVYRPAAFNIRGALGIDVLF